MAKKIIINDKVYRIRRGQLVQIPIKWLGKITTKQTIRKRQSKKGRGCSFKRKCMR